MLVDVGCLLVGMEGCLGVGMQEECVRPPSAFQPQRSWWGLWGCHAGFMKRCFGGSGLPQYWVCCSCIVVVVVFLTLARQNQVTLNLGA